MVVCKYFLQGTCKFGSYCKYEHQIPANYNYSSFSDNAQKSTSILRQASFGNVQQSNPSKMGTQITDLNTLTKVVVNEMTGAEKGGQWLLSSYAPYKDKLAFPGFEDHSPEEIRWGFYEAKKNGTMEQYKQQLQMLLQNTIVKVRALQNPSSDTIAMLQQIYNSPSSIAQETNVFTTQKANNIFASQLGNQQNAFGANSISQQPSENNIFAAASKNIFSSGQASNIFAPKGGFGDQQQQQQQQQQNIFATTANQQGSNIFAAAQQNVFASPPQQQNVFASNNIFQQQPSSNIFASAQQPLLNMASNSPLNPQQSVLQQPPPNYSATIFGSASTFQPQTVDATLYSKLEELDADDRKWFESDSVDIMNIPDKPPTYEMCCLKT